MTNRTNGHADSGKAMAMNRAMRQIAEEMAASIINNVHTRPGFYRNQGAGQIDERRDYNAEFGYPTTDMISAYGNDSIYKTLYDRSPIAARVVEVLPDETWKDSPNVWETPDLKCCTSFEREFNQMCECLGGQSWFQDDKVNPLWEYLRRFDIQAGIGHFGIMLLGINDGLELSLPIEGIDACGFKVKPKTMVSMANPKKPAKQGRKRKLNFVRVFNESMVQVSQWEADRKNPRYGQPTMYNVTFNDLTSAGMTGIGMPTMTADVHWTRVIHLADNPESHESVSVPRMRPVLNNLIDLVKIYGGSGEAFWQAIAPALAFETLPSLGGDVEVDADEIKQQYWDFVNHFQRSLILKGMSAKPLSSPIASPEPQINVHLQAISIKLNMPMRIFMGSERGELSSGQDANEWNMRLKGRRKNVATSRIIVPTVNRLIALDVLPPPDKAFTVAWPDPGLAPTDQATIANTQTTAIAAYVAGGVNALIPEEQFLTKIMGLPEDDVKTMLEAASEAITAEGDPELAGPLAQKQAADAEKQQEQMDAQQEHELGMAKEQAKGKAPIQLPPGQGGPPNGPPGAGGKPPFPPKKGPPKPPGLNELTANRVVKIKGGKYRLLSHEGENLGTFDTAEDAWQHEREVQYFKHARNSNPEGCNQYKPCGQAGASKEANDLMDDEEGYAAKVEAEMKAMTDAMPKVGKMRAHGNTLEWTSGPQPLDDVDVDDQFWDSRNRFEDLGFVMEGTSETTGPNRTEFKLVHPSGSTFEAKTERGDVGGDNEWRQRTIKLTMNYDPDQTRDESGRWSTGGGGGAVAYEETAAGWDDADYEDTAYATEPDYARVGPTHTYKPDVTDDSDGDGVTDHARVGVPAKAVLPPPPVPALPNLTEAEREVEQSFAKAFEADPDGMADKFRQMAVVRAKGGAPTFGTDDAKELHAKWSSDQLSLDERSQNRAEYNLALHQTANAITKRAFLQHLDTLPPGSEVMVTCGGCGAGKGYALKNVPEALAMKDRSAVVWDSAGDQNATENPWIQEAAEARGLKVNYVYVHADPETQWAHPERGVVKRAQDPNDGRMVDAKVFADSYALGAQNHQAFYERNQDNPNAKFTFLANGNPPRLLDGIPKEALSIDRNHLAQFAMKTVRDPERAVPPHIIRGATIGARVWKGDLADNSAAVGRRIDAVTINMDPFDAEWEAQVAEERAASEFAGQFFRDRDWQVHFPEERLKPVPLNPNGTEKKPTANAFCPTGPGGGIDNSCGRSTGAIPGAGTAADRREARRLDAILREKSKAINEASNKVKRIPAPKKGSKPSAPRKRAEQAEKKAREEYRAVHEELMDHMEKTGIRGLRDFELAPLPEDTKGDNAYLDQFGQEDYEDAIAEHYQEISRVVLEDAGLHDSPPQNITPTDDGLTWDAPMVDVSYLAADRLWESGKTAYGNDMVTHPRGHRVIVSKDGKGHRLIFNQFCPTGPGGGVDPTCSPVRGLKTYRGGTDKEGSLVTYHTTSKEMAESYADMYNDRFGSGGAVHEGTVTIDKPAPAETVSQIASDLGIENDDYTPASVFDYNLHGKDAVQKLVGRLQEQGYDGAVLDDIAYGRNVQDKAYVSFTKPAAFKLSPIPSSVPKATLRKAEKDTARVFPKGTPEYELTLRKRLGLNQFCATGPGGGVDPTCGKGGVKSDDHSLSGSMGHKEGYDSTEAGDVISKASMAGFEAEHERLSKEMDERNWDDATARALRDYTDKNKGGQLNKDARSCTPVPDCTTDPTMFAAVQRETSQPLAEPVTVYRGLYGGYAEKFLAMNPGETEVMKGFVSTSINRQVASDFGESGKGQTQVVLKITAKTGAYVGHVSNFPNELEILQSHGVEYVYKGQSYDKNTGLYTVEMEEK